MTGRYRILYHHRIRADDGQAVHVKELIGALRAAGHDVHECALVPKTTGVEAARKAGLWQRLSLPRPAVELLEILYDRRGRAMLREAARTFRPHFVYERHALHCRTGLDVARQLGLPLLLEVNSPMVAEMQQLGRLRFRRRALATEREVLGGADAVLAVTRVLGDLLVPAGARVDHLHVIGNGAVPERYDAAAQQLARTLRATWDLPSGAFVLGFVGYARPWHRLDLVLDVMTRPGLEALALVVLGEGPALPALIERTKALGLGARVRFLGAVPGTALPAHVLACDGALIPAINAYASPLKLFDSLAAGVVTVAPDQPNLRETVRDGENALLFEPGSADALAGQLARLVGDRGFAQRLGAAGRDSLVRNRWTWAGNAERVIGVYERLAVGAR